jgi:DNA repair protein RadC
VKLGKSCGRSAAAIDVQPPLPRESPLQGGSLAGFFYLNLTQGEILLIHDKTLYIHDGEGKYVPAPSNLVIEEAKRRLGARLEGLNALTSPALARDAIRLRFAGLEHEIFACLFLDNQHRVIKFEELFRGTIDGASVYPREVVKAALAHNSAAVMFCHNHPSGVAEPSEADKFITKRLKDALMMVDIRVLDHFIVGEDIYSFAEHGLS